jgi:hypothetical protein
MRYSCSNDASYKGRALVSILVNQFKLASRVCANPIRLSCTQGFGAVATLNLAVMSGNVAGRTKQVVASTLAFMYGSLLLFNLVTASELCFDTLQRVGRRECNRPSRYLDNGPQRRFIWC